MIDVHDANRLLEWMRLNRVRHARLGHVEIWLDEDAPQPAALEELPKSEPRSYADPLDDPDLWGGQPPPNFLVEDEKK